MRSALFLLSGLVLVGAGIAIIASGVPGRFLLGPALVVAGLLFKVGGFLLTDDPGPGRSGRRTGTTLGGQTPERPQAGAPAGRISTLRATRPVAGRSTGLPTARRDAYPHRRAS